MRTRFKKSAGAVIFHKSVDGRIEYLLLNHGPSRKPDFEYWNFPKGGMERGESEMEAAKREIEEESGLSDLKIFSGFRVLERYFTRGMKLSNKDKVFFKTVVFFLAQAKNKEIKLSDEHVGYEWLPYEAALERIRLHKKSQKVLERADKFIKKLQNNAS